MSIITDEKEQLETAKKAIADINVKISELMHLKPTWLKIQGSLEYQINGRILP